MMAKTFIAKIVLHRSLPRRCLWKQDEFKRMRRPNCRAWLTIAVRPRAKCERGAA
jgi:hypothetical protein